MRVITNLVLFMLVSMSAAVWAQEIKYLDATQKDVIIKTLETIDSFSILHKEKYEKGFKVSGNALVSSLNYSDQTWNELAASWPSIALGGFHYISTHRKNAAAYTYSISFICKGGEVALVSVAPSILNEYMLKRTSENAVKLSESIFIITGKR